MEFEEINTQTNFNIFKEILFEHDYLLGEPVGHGSYANVFLVYSNKYNQNFVVKISDFSGTKAHKIDEATKSEVDALCQLDHPNIISIYDHFSHDPYYFIILEYCEGGSLYDILLKNGPLNLKEISIYFKQVFSALIYCHSKSISHSDLKPSNILIDKHGRPKLADFGLSQKFILGKRTSTFCGSKPYMAPELWSRKAYDPKSADVWSLGCTIFLLATGKLPWNTSNELQMERMIKAGVVLFPQDLTHELIIILKKMLIVDPNRREPLEKLLKNNFFNNNDLLIKKNIKRSIKKMISYDASNFSKLQSDKPIIRSFLKPTFSQLFNDNQLLKN